MPKRAGEMWSTSHTVRSYHRLGLSNPCLRAIQEQDELQKRSDELFRQQKSELINVSPEMAEVVTKIEDQDIPKWQKKKVFLPVRRDATWAHRRPQMLF